MNATDDAPLAESFALVMSWVFSRLIGLVAARHDVLGAHAAPLVERLARALTRLATLMARLAHGRPYRAARDRKGVKGGPRPVHAFPGQRGWLLAALGAEAVAHRENLEQLLADPAAAAVFAAKPTALRLVRPLCHMLGLPDPAPGAPSRILPPPPPAAEPAPPARRAKKPVWDYHPAAHPWGHPVPPYLGLDFGEPS